MSNNDESLRFVKQVLQNADQTNSYPLIYCLWGSIVFIGYAVMEFRLDISTIYWVGSTPLGILASIWLGIRHDKARGVQDDKLGNQYMTHFGLMGAVIFSAIFTQQYQAILMIVALGYALAGVYLDRLMLWIGGLSLVAYFAIHIGLLSNYLVLGAVFAAGFYALAWSSARLNRRVLTS